MSRILRYTDVSDQAQHRSSVLASAGTPGLWEAGPMNGSSGDAEGKALERFRPYLRLLAEASVGQANHAKIEASDVVQQTLLEAHQQWGQFRGQSDAELAGWLRRILQNNLTDAARAVGRAKRDVARERSLEGAVEDSSARLNAWLADEQISPSQAAVRVEDLFRMTEALIKLPEDQRKAVTGRHLEGLSLRELAERLGRSESAVAGLIHRGLKELRELLGAGG